ncbi:hypothetical protein LCGC14_2514310 [marine sediment metagenome]|uniref:RNA polymerase sigma factor 70 region 4 type 2 domain-containing protein n=1 Tax=marine sediment metagenome TaxID=412755 RepID=A0A0F9D9X2_9ZZZZ
MGLLAIKFINIGCATGLYAVYIGEGFIRKVGLKDQTSILLEFLESAGGSLHTLLTRLTLREDVAEDLMQELFIKLSRAKGFAKADNHLAYARRAAMHLAFDWRRLQERKSVTAAMITEPLAANLLPLSKLISDEQLGQILDAVGRLSELSREAFVMRHIQQEPYEAVANQLDKTPHQVRALCHKAVEQIRSLLNNKSPRRHRKEESHVQD